MTKEQKKQRLLDRQDYLSSLRVKHDHYVSVIRDVEQQIADLEAQPTSD